MPDLDRAIEDQRLLITRLSRFMDEYEKLPTISRTRGISQTVLDKIEEINRLFESNHERIYDYIRDSSISTSDVPYLSEDVYFAFCHDFMIAKGKLLDAMVEFNATISPTLHSSTFHASSHRGDSSLNDVRLPKIDIPVFSGNYLDWISYRDMFVSVVHNNQGLSDVQKYYYLKGSCKDTPLSIVNDYPASDTSYQLAWSALTRRYHNKRKISDTIFRKLFDIRKSDGSCDSIKNILDSTRTCIALFTTLQIDCGNWGPILIHITVSKLDIQTCKEWERSLKASTEIPKLEELFLFLETTFRTLESVNDHDLSMVRPTVKPFNNSFRPLQTRRVHLVSSHDDNCPCCGKRHLLYKCFQFAAQSSTAKRDLIFSKNICRNCLNVGHFSKDCRLHTRCHICQLPHHTIVHNEFSNDRQLASSSSASTSAASADIADVVESATPDLNCHLSVLNSIVMPNVLLATVRVIVQTHFGDFTLRAILDQGAQATLITESAAQLLGLRRSSTHVRINGIGGESIVVRSYVNFCLISSYEKGFRLESNAFVMPSLTSYHPGPIGRCQLPDLEGYHLADPQFYGNDKIDLLIGGDLYGDILLPQQRKFKKGIFLQLSHFGWVVSGPTASPGFSFDVNVNMCSLDSLLKAFWEQEELVEKRASTQEDNLCEEYFRRTYSRGKDGRYTVALPFKSELYGKEAPKFSHTDFLALKRLKSMEDRFDRDNGLALQYRSFMAEYESLGHMRNIGIYPQALRQHGYFLPHHGVLRESSSTTKLRVVFDGSSKRPPYSSLNDELCSGPALQNDLPTIITRWRRYKIGFRSDLEKMFRQIKVIDRHQPYQQILWRGADSSINIYELQTVTYGTSPAPYLSIRVLHQLAKDEYHTYPEACDIVKTDTYVDDVISGADTIGEAKSLQERLVKLLASGGFNLRKWTSNSTELMEHIPDEFREKVDLIAFEEQNLVKALGLAWDIRGDSFTFKVNFQSQDEVTKSSLLSDASKLYDPLGWLAPVTINAKATFQKLWLEGIDWKDRVPFAIQTYWTKYIAELINLERIRIPRWIGCFKYSRIELHGFCDASQTAFAAAVYAKVLCNEKPTNQLDREISKIFYWTDSITALCWIRGESAKWNVFVGNRVADIQRYTNISEWFYVSSHDNPADCASRGIPATELVNHELWWSGPEWLLLSQSEWPPQPTSSYETDLEKRKQKIVINLVTTPDYPELLSKFASLTRLVRITAVILRFYHNIKTATQHRMFGYLKTKELDGALNLLIFLSQRVDFDDELTCLQKGYELSKASGIAKLCPFIDENGILRVGGRLQKAKFNYEYKHPILLSKHNPLSRLILSDAHVKTLHGGLTQMQAYATRKFWIISARNIAKQVQRKCVTCFRYKAKTAEQIMGDLPTVRLQPTRPFKHSGVDYAGPITIKQSTARNSVTTKGYICLFICMVTKALHLEAVTSLSTDSFIAAFRRFTSRRGVCTDLYSDCGTNFIGANKELKILQRRSRDSVPEELYEILANNGTKWHFIPPASPNFGGLWEAGVKSTKHHLRRTMENRILTFEELTTLLAQIEGCLNSRPLCPLSPDPNDCTALTPAHFIVVVERLKQQFWKRWVSEFVNRLQSRPKWLKPQNNLEVGDLVLVFDERLPPGQWPLARISEVHPGSDGRFSEQPAAANDSIKTLFADIVTFVPLLLLLALLPLMLSVVVEKCSSQIEFFKNMTKNNNSSQQKQNAIRGCERRDEHPRDEENKRTRKYLQTNKQTPLLHLVVYS
ncbi:uncharacterized protein LOC131995236 [Stomoxys calcitrans]|uniref:uncharacterized protein LOC131995236 n=1 Tax=Stomoxys calcitrans TaxID=35570 RepID=UPI0027E21BE6|nr:uncharacterized protein LOC131995236 [Stomoxys calcitrans]